MEKLEKGLNNKQQKEIVKIARSYSIDEVRSALVYLWLSNNNMDFTQLDGAETTKKILNLNINDDLYYSDKGFNGLENVRSIKELENAFESLLSFEQRRLNGAVYTPDYIINNLVREGLSFGWKDSSKIPLLCDPACGSGGFLIKFAEILEHYGFDLLTAFNECIYGIDKDPLSITNAKCLIELYLMKKGYSLDRLQLNLINADTLVETEELIDIFGLDRGFDLISTNPPYVKLQNLDPDYREQLLHLYPRYALGSFSLSMLFLIACHGMLSESGCLSMITQNNLFSSLAGKEVRKYLQEEKCIRRVVDFGHNKIFNGVSSYTCLIFIDKIKKESFEYASLNKTFYPEELDSLEFSTIDFKDLNYKKWRLAKRKHLKNLYHIEGLGTPLGKLAPIRVGFATLKDKIFFVWDKGDYCITNGQLGQKMKIEKGITAPAIKIASIQSSEDVYKNSLRIIRPYKKLEGRWVLLSEEELQENYPSAYKYLISCQDTLNTRDKGKSQEAWYAWGRTQGMEAPGPKLLIKTFDRSPNFYLDKSDQLFCNGYAVFPPKKTLNSPNISLVILQKILNSKMMHYYAKLTSFQIGGDYQCYQKNFIEPFGIPHLSEEQAAKIQELEGDDLENYICHLYDVDPEEIKEIIF